ncbi:PREDICTED: vitellogenin receptor-like [Wasmannia auropunctata]|uniref:vitellogenin receptor-like n=1 Tax=Wasmannia auropunctata TaxID=64793 RepID=UPI0005EDB2FF|nr:PREDICTED: vitellogenin receptor-like [Wasmannia auropunctata]
MNRLVLIFICNFLYIYLSQALYEKREAPSELSPQRLERFIFPFFRIHRIPHDIDLPGCPPDHFACNDGKCVEMNWKCDGIPDCKDGEDEANCKYSSSSRSNLKCSKHEFKCKNNIECIPQAKFCDAKEDCQDGSDEYDGCVNDLPCDDKFRCSDRHCVIKEWVCDGSEDCSDGSDEWNCKGENRTSSASDCKIENYQYFCGNQRCISLNAVCNKKDDCGDGSDEGAGCTPSKCPSSVKCDHECKQTPKGSICLCRPGYKLQNDNRTCIDINECQTYGICDQECVNSQGSYNCMCQKDYVLQGDKKTCKAHAGEATIVFSTRTEIVGMYLDSKITFKIASNLNHAVGVAMNGDDVYWSNFKGDSEMIVRKIHNSKEQESIVTTGLSLISGIAVDWITENIYFTDMGYHRIGVCNNNGMYCTVLINDTDKPAGIVLLPTRGEMYWCDWGGSKPHISVAGMNGKNIRIFVSESLGWPKSMTIDYPNDRLYWVDAKLKIIESIRLDGTDRRVSCIRILGTGLKPASLAVAGDNIFWAEDGSDKIFWTDFKNTFRLNQKKIAFHVPNLNTLMRKFVITLRKDVLRQDHDCQKNNGHCSHVCLLSSITSFTCACPPGLGLSYDNRTCIAYECSRNEYKCRGHNICISKTKLCDGIIHCPNGEDETVNCHEKQKCKEDDFMCKNGECINSKDRCNSHYDCADQSDEEDCKPKYDEFLCLDGTAIPKTVVCDGESDCIDGEDEAPERCKSDACQHEEFRCDNGNCISSSLKCDGIDDCHDGSDEWNCLDTKTNYSVNCTADEYNCLGTKLCLPKKARCNGVIDCMSHDDEFNCPSCFDSEFTCDNGKCIPKDWVCDNRDDCNDNSDEDNCDGRKKIVKESDECYEFKCSNGACLPYSKTCDDIRNCQDGSDEDGKCNNACAEDNICKDMCYKTPKGAVCGCQIGYRLAADAISCEDINECKDDVCSQICNNTEGSYMCSCYEGYIIRNDKVSCKAIGPGMEFVTVTDYDIRMISSNFHSVDKIFSLSRMSKIEPGGLDVNAVSRSVYWSNSEYGTINKFSIKTEEITAFAIVERPHALAVDWITDNVYVYDNSRQNTIKVCNLEQQRCVALIEIKDKEKIGFLLVDAVNRWLFWSQMTCQMSKQAKSCSTIYRTDLMGVDMKIIGSTAGFVTGITIDYIRSKLYWSDDLGKIESSNLDGSQRSTFLNTDLPVLAISIYEQKLYWLNQKAQLQICYLYGKKSCDTFNFGTNNFHSHFTILHISRQPIAKNPCDEESCDYMCVLKKDNATCVCSDGEPIGSNRTCMMNMNSEPKLTNLSTSTRSASGVYSITIIVLLVGVLLLCVYYYYQKTRLKLKSTNDLSYSNIRFQNPSYDRRDEVEVTLNSVSSELAPGQHEYVNPIDDKVLRMKAATESRRKSDQYPEEKDAEETEKQDASLIYFFQSK